MKLLHPDLLDLARDLFIHTDRSVSLNGRQILEAGDASGFERRLSSALYSQWYTRSRLMEAEGLMSSEAFLASLIHANLAVDRFDCGWTVKKVLHNGVLVRKGQRERQVEAGEFVLRNPGAVPRDGTKIDLFVPRDNQQLQSNYYYVFGATLDPVGERRYEVRFYFAIESQEAPRLLRWITQELNDFGIPFRFKCLNDPKSFHRADTAVLYVARRFFQIVALLVRAHWNLPARALPALTHPVAAAVSIAENPPGIYSFGDHRCQLIAAALTKPISFDVEGRERSLVAAFRDAGLDPARPWLNSGSENLNVP